MTSKYNMKYQLALAIISKMLRENKITEQEFDILDLRYKKMFC